VCGGQGGSPTGVTIGGQRGVLPDRFPKPQRGGKRRPNVGSNRGLQIRERNSRVTAAQQPAKTCGVEVLGRNKGREGTRLFKERFGG